MIKKRRQWLLLEILSFIVFLIKDRKHEKSRRIEVAKSKVSFKDLYKRHSSMCTEEVVRILNNIHLCCGIPTEGTMILWFIEIIEGFRRRPDAVRYVDFLAEMVNWPELRVNDFNRNVFQALIEIIELCPRQSLIKPLEQRINCLNQAMIGVPRNTVLAADIAYERNKLAMFIAQCEFLSVDTQLQ